MTTCAIEGCDERGLASVGEGDARLTLCQQHWLDYMVLFQIVWEIRLLMEKVARTPANTADR